LFKFDEDFLKEQQNQEEKKEPIMKDISNYEKKE
jgi:hypothetical protein